MAYALDEREGSFRIRFEELHLGRERESGPVRVDAFEVFHQPHTAPHGLRVRLGSRRFVYSADSGLFPGFADRVGEPDSFVCECTYPENDFAYRISQRDLVARRYEFRCERITLTHLGEEMLPHRGHAAFETLHDALRVGL